MYKDCDAYIKRIKWIEFKHNRKTEYSIKFKRKKEMFSYAEHIFLRRLL